MDVLTLDDLSLPQAAEAPDVLSPEEFHQTNQREWAKTGFERAKAAVPAKQGRLDYVMERLPIAGGFYAGAKAIDLTKSVKAIQNGTADQTDFNFVQHALNRRKEESEKSWLTRTGDIITQLPGFATEFAATGGVFSGGKNLAQGAATRILGKAAEEGAVGLATKAAVNLAGSAAQTLAMPQRVGQNTLERMAPEVSSEAAQAGDISHLVSKEGDDFKTALAKGFGDTLIENTSERMGGFLEKATGVTALKSVIAKRFMLKTGANASTFGKILKTAGWDGVIGEVLEERVGEVARGATGVTDNYGVTGNLIAGDRAAALSQLASEAVAFSIPGAANVAINAPAQAARGQKLAKLKEIRAKGWVSAEDAQLTGTGGGNRKERLANLDSAIKQEEIQNASTVRSDQTEVPRGQEQGGQDLRGNGQEQIPAQPAGQNAPEAPQVPDEIDQDIMAVLAMQAAEKPAQEAPKPPEEVLAKGPTDITVGEPVPPPKMATFGTSGMQSVLKAPPVEQPKKNMGRKEMPIVQFKKDAEAITASLPPVPEGHVRLWRGNRKGEVGQNPSFTNDLPGIALPFQKGYGGELSYVDVPASELPKLERAGGAPGAEFFVPKDIAAKAIVTASPYSPSQPPESLPSAPKQELAPEPAPAVPVTPAKPLEAEQPVKRPYKKVPVQPAEPTAIQAKPERTRMDLILEEAESKRRGRKSEAVQPKKGEHGFVPLADVIEPPKKGTKAYFKAYSEEIGKYRLGPVETETGTKFGVFAVGDESGGPVATYDGRDTAIQFMETQKKADEPVQPKELVTKAEPPESPWASETRKRLSAAPAFKDSKIDLDETLGTAKVTRPDGRTTTIHLKADEELDRIAQQKGRNPKSVSGAYVFKTGKEGRLTEGNIYLRSDAGHRTLNHEIVHWLEDEGIVTPDEVAAHGGREGIATAYGQWVADKQAKPNTVFQRVYDFLEPIFSSKAKLFSDIGERGTQVAKKPKRGGKPKASEPQTAIPDTPKTALQQASDKATQESASEEAQRKSEEARGESQASGFAGGGLLSTERIRDDQIPDVIKAPAEQEERLQKARGMKKPSLLARIKEGLTHLRNVTRAQEHLPNTPENAAANEFFRLIKNVPAMAQDEAVRMTAAIADPLGPKQLYLFERYAVMENLAASIKLGQPLRFGFKSAEDVEAYRAKIQDVVERVPAVKEAIETRKKIVKEIVDKLVGYDLLPKSARENAETYYHQQVHFYMLARMKGGGTRAGKIGRSFQRARVEGEALTSEEMDYNTSYLESEISWLTDATMEIEKERLLRQLMDKEDIQKELQKQAGKGRWQDLVPEGYEVFQPEPGNTFYRAFTLPERIVEQLQENVLETAELSAEDLRQVLALAGPKRQFVVRSEIAAQLAATRKGEAPHGLALIADEAMRMWKAWTLLNPKRALTYNLRNITGDIDPVVAADPSLLRQAGRALKELANYHKGRLQLSPELRAARDLGVIGSGFAAEEIPDIKDLAVFRRFIGTAGRSKFHPLSVVQGYMDIIKPFTNWREDALRYAAFLGYRDQFRQGRVKHYGGAKKAVVDQIKKDLGVDAAAAHLARNLLGDYGNISVAGNWIRRRLAPFWSFQEINLKRVPRLLVNAYEAGGASKLSAAVGRTILMSRIAWMYGALWVWNHLIQGGDEEDELTGADRAVPHVILGRNPDGSIRVFRRVGALGDFLEWFGINEALAMLGKYKAGQVDSSDILKEMAFATPEKAMDSLRPDLKALYEIPTGQSLFPEPFQPRSVRRDEASAGIFGLEDEYKWMKGWTLRDGNTARPHYWQRWLYGVVDPRQSALSEIYDLRSDFLKKKGKEEKGAFPVSKYKEARDAAKSEDYRAFTDWKRKFVADNGEKARDAFADWLDTLDPISSRLNDADELEFETKFLTKEQRGKLAVARNYSHELRDLLVTWWVADEKSHAE